MIYWIHTPVQESVRLTNNVFAGVRCTVSCGSLPGEDHEDSFTAYGNGAYSYTDVVDVPEHLVESFEAFLARVRDAGIVLEIVGKSE